MSIYLRTRVEDVRALASAIALGSSAGLVIGAVYLAGGARSVDKPPAAAPSQLQAATTRREVLMARPHASSRAGRQVSPALGMTAALRDRLGLTGFSARPFRFQQVASAPTDLHCLTEAVYFEARGEGQAGQQAVAQVVLNRVRHPAFPKTICAVVHQRAASGCQFSFACGREDAADAVAWRRAQTIASNALHGTVMAAVGDATHFQAARASAFAGLLKVAQVGEHIFYRFAGRSGAAAMFRQSPKPSAGSDRTQIARLDAGTPLTAGVKLNEAEGSSPPVAATVPASVALVLTSPGASPAEPGVKPIEIQPPVTAAATRINGLASPAKPSLATKIALTQS